MTVTTTAPLRGPTGSTERVLAPDLARGLMLLLIALANVPWYLYTADAGFSSVHDRNGSALDRVVQLFMITAVDLRIYPMFAFLFGYGIAQLYRRQVESGAAERDARRLLRRRHLWMIGFGLLDAALLWMGDILGAYGLVGLILVRVFIRRRDRTLKIWAVVWASLLTLSVIGAVVGSVFAARAPAPTGPIDNFLQGAIEINGQPDYLASMALRLQLWPLLTLIQGLLTLAIPLAVVLAFWAGRRQILERPGDHLPLLRRVAVVGVAIGWLGGFPHALYHLGVLSIPDQVAWVFDATQTATGLAAGLGYVAVFALLAHRLGPSGVRSRAGRAVVAVGRRSLSCYLAQSALFAIPLCAWGFGLGAVLTSTTAALYAVGVWLVTVVGAAALEARSRRGPAETLLRRLSYGAASARRTQTPRSTQ